MLRVTTRFGGPSGAPFWSTHYFGGTGQTQAQAAAAAVRAFWFGFVAGLRNDMEAVVQPEVEGVDPATGNVLAVYSTTTALVDFTSTGDYLPLTNQLLVRWRTGVFVSGKEIRGRTFIPGYTESSSTAGRPVASTVTGAAALAQQLLADGVDAGTFGIYSPTRRQFAAVVSTSVWAEWAVLRSRRD